MSYFPFSPIWHSFVQILQTHVHNSLLNIVQAQYFFEVLMASKTYCNNTLKPVGRIQGNHSRSQKTLKYTIAVVLILLLLQWVGRRILCFFCRVCTNISIILIYNYDYTIYCRIYKCIFLYNLLCLSMYLYNYFS